MNLLRFRFLGSAFAFLALACLVAAQSTIRDPIPELATDRFSFREGRNTFTVPCNSTVSLAQPTPGIRHLVVMVHGLDRKPHYHEVAVDTLKLAEATEGVAIMSPQFLIREDVEHHKLPREAPYWSVNGWPIGHNSRSDEELPRPARISSFAVVDALLLRAVELLPDLQSVVVAGFSAGGQFLNRYAAGSLAHNTLERRGLDVVYVASSPSSYLYFCKNRVISTEPLAFGPVAQSAYPDCTNFNVYRQGLDDLNQYMQRSGPNRLRENYGKRRVVYLVGGQDDASASRNLATGCESMLQGAHRLERAMIYQEYLKFHYGPQIAETHKLLISPEAAHNSRRTFVTPQGIEALLGNFKR